MEYLKKICLFINALILILGSYSVASLEDNELKLITIATDVTDGLRRYLRSTNKYGLDVEVFGMGQDWRGGDVANHAGGGHKVNILRKELEKYKDRDDLILMFTDSYDVVLTAGKKEILEKFKKFNARVVFSAEGFCWPDPSLANSYPDVKENEKRYLNSGGYIGYAKDLYEIITHRDIKDTDDDQLYFTNIFLDKTLRKKWNMKLDVKSDLFQNLNGALDDVTIKFKSDHSFAYNVKTGTTPIVLHGNGPIKPQFNRIANYLVDGWTTQSGCISCKEETISIRDLKDEEFPSVLLSLFFEQPTPFAEEFLERIAQLKYPKSRMDLFIHNNVEFHNIDVANFLEKYNDLYRSTTVLMPSDGVHQPAARNWAVEVCKQKNDQYLFSVDAYAQISDPDTLIDLIEQNRTVLAPILSRPYKLWSNFWGAVDRNGWYMRSEDYIDIVEKRKIGLWNVPYITGAYLIHGSLMKDLRDIYMDEGKEADMAFCGGLRQRGIFMYATNRKIHGHLVEFDDMETSHLHNDLYQIFQNPYDWEQKYIHENYSKSLEVESIKELVQPCPDVFWFPIVTNRFADELVAEMEHANQWSGGKNEDPRLATGYENVPTVDTHMNQIGLEKQWLQFLKVYISPLQEKAFAGYHSDPPRAIMNFVVRYRPNEQDRLRPHHDSSTFTINIALNTPKVDFEGGGCRFIRYKCSVTATRKGWMLMHPGRLTHFHEGLVVTKGTRYIMISFVDP
ncbi:multifunctional procollagen lysine hydroxylase and glycosyltransferase LH3-like [Saccostrea cucullata]|uniref:multifunctional procollagen lysine hydroxylase and glycosyltransferase LH3-like n=1 Tax=Saccostrea cuccullata TaxID=36930 RepID=UPI002ED1D63D